MQKKISVVYPALAGLFAAMLSGAIARADDTITITTTHTKCQVSPPADVTPPATPSVAAGAAAARNKDFALARANFQPLAEKGDMEAARAMGQLLMQDCTGLQDKAAAASWLSKAADGGDVLAQNRLGSAYINGEGVAQDDGKALIYLTKAATAGNVNAQKSLGYLYLSGRVVPVDRYQGIVWSVKAAEQGDPIALSNIAEAYLKGNALPQDNDKAAYYLLAAIQHSSPIERARFVAANNSIARAMSPDDMQRAAQRARRWSPGKGSLSDVVDDAARQRDRKP